MEQFKAIKEKTTWENVGPTIRFGLACGKSVAIYLLRFSYEAFVMYFHSKDDLNEEHSPLNMLPRPVYINVHIKHGVLGIASSPLKMILVLYHQA